MASMFPFSASFFKVVAFALFKSTLLLLDGIVFLLVLEIVVVEGFLVLLDEEVLLFWVGLDALFSELDVVFVGVVWFFEFVGWEMAEELVLFDLKTGLTGNPSGR